MIIEKSSQEKEQINDNTIKKDDFLVVKNLTSKDNFDICMVLKNPDNDESEIRVLQFQRVDQNFQNFEPQKELHIAKDKILFKARGLKVKDVEMKGSLETLVCFSSKKYKATKDRVAIEVEADLKLQKDQQSESDSELEEQLEITQKAIQKLRRSKIKIKGKKSISKSKSKQKVQKNSQFKFKRGKDNLRVNFRKQSKQLQSKKSEPNLDCCIRCNTKEIIRAVSNDDEKLIEQLLEKPEQISTINPNVSPLQQYDALRYALEQGNSRIFKYIFELQKESFNFGYVKRGFEYQDTGFNDKYAYGVATQKVQLGRGNREGNNAFTYDDNMHTSRLNYENFFYARYLDQDIFNLINAGQNNIKYQIVNQTVQKAVIMGNLELSRAIMKYCYDSDGYNLNEFHYLALSAQSIDQISHIKRMNVGKKSIGSFRDITPVHCAAINPCGDILKYMLEVGGDLFVNDADMRKPIHYAACAETNAGLQVLLQLQCDTRITDADKMTPLMYAARAGRTKNIQIICQTVQQNLELKSKYGAAALHYAAQFNNLEALKELVYQGADVNSTCSKRVYALMLASQIGNLEMVEFLLQKGAKIIRTDAHGRTALIYAVMSGHLSVASILLQKGIEFDRGDKSNNTPLHYACAYGYYEMIPLLMEAGADPNIVNDWNYSPLLVALIKGHMRCVKVLLDFDSVDVNIRDDKGRSFLISLIMKLDPDQEKLVVQLVKEKGANLHQRDLAGNTALHVLASKKFEEHNLQARDYLKYQEEKIAFKEQYRMYFNLLLKFESNINDLNFDEQTPLEVAIINRNWFFVELAIQYEGLQITIPKRKTHTILNSCRFLMLKQSGHKIFQQILDKINNIQDFEDVYNDHGFNFIHSFVQFFIQKDSWQAKITQIVQKLNKLNELYNQCQQNQGFGKVHTLDKIPNLQNIKTELNLKIQKLSNFKDKFYQIFKDNFVKMLDYLMSRNVDFSRPIKTKISKIQEKYENQWVQYQQSKLQYNKEKLQLAKQTENQYKRVINNNAGSTFLHLLMKNPSHAIFAKVYQYMVKTKTFQNNVKNYFGETIIQKFCQSDAQNCQILQFLLEIGEDPNICDENQIYPIHHLCEQNKLQAFEILCNGKTQIEAEDKKGRTALLIVSKYRLIKHLRILLNKNCNINKQDQCGMNALHISINYSQEQDANFEFEDLLIENKIDVNAFDKEQRNPIHYFFVKKKKRFISDKIDPIDCFEILMIQQSLQYQNKDVYGNTPLHYACQRGAFLCSSKLLKFYNNIDAQNINNNTPLNISLIFNHTNIAIMLLQMNCSVNQKIQIYNFYAAEQYQKMKEQEKEMVIEENEILLKIRDFDFHQIFYQNTNKRKGGRQKKAKKGLGINQRKTTYGTFGTNYTNYNNYGNLNTFGNRNNNQTSDYYQQYDKHYTKKELLELKEKNFISQRFSTFTHSCNKNDESLKYLIIDNGFPIHTAIKESLKFARYQYSFVLFNKKLHQQKEENDKIYITKDKKMRTIVHYFCKYFKANQNEDLFNKLYNQLIDKKFDFTSKDQDGKNGLHIIAQYNFSQKMIEKLIEQGVNPLEEDNNGNNMFSCLLQNQNLGYLRQTKFLKNTQNLSKGFEQDFLQKNLFGTQQPINNMLQFKNERSKYSKYHAQKRPSLYSNQDLDSSFSQINYNRQLSNLNISGNDFKNFYSLFQKYLKDYNIDQDYQFTIKNNEQKEIYSLLSYSICVLKNLDLASLFLKMNHDINFQNEKNRTILTYAIKKNDPVLINFLLEFEDKIDFDIIDKKGNSYIHTCVMPLKCGTFQNIDLLSTLCDKTEINLRNVEGYTPLDLAQKLKNKRLEDYLKSRNGKNSNKKKQRASFRYEEFLESYEKNIKLDEDYNNYVEENQKNINYDKIIKERKKLDNRIQGDVEMLKDNNGKPYDILLVKVDIHYGQYSQNVYYKMQIAKDKLRQIYILFTNWGRIGTTGQHQLTPFFKKEQCIEEFCKIFKQKTGNVYTENNFERKTRKYSLVKFTQKKSGTEILGIDKLENQKIAESKLPQDIYELFQDIFNYDDIKKTYQKQEIDEDLMPFGNLELDQLNQAKIIIEEIKEKIDKLEENKKDYTSYELFDKYTQICDYSSSVFELLPMERNKYGPLMAINKNEAIQLLQKINILQSITYLKKIFFASYHQRNKINPIDYCFNLMNIGIRQIDENQDFFKLIQKFLKNDDLGEQYKIDKIFQINQKSQVGKQDIFEKSDNQKYLVYKVNKSDIISSFAKGFQKQTNTLSHYETNFGNCYQLFEQISQVRQNIYTPESDSHHFYFILAKLVLDDLQVVKGRHKDWNAIKKESSVIQLYGSQQKLEYQNVILKDKASLNIGKTIKVNDNKEKCVIGYTEVAHNKYIVEDESLIDFKYLIRCKSEDK